MKVCTAEQMREIDRCAIESGLIPGIILMENAAHACVFQIEKLSPKHVGIFCGKGNNGGDGFAIARLLFTKGYNVEVFLVCGSDFSNDALINYNIIERMNIKITSITELTDSSQLEYYITRQDLIVDAIFGTGIHGEISGLCLDVIESINLNAKKILSVDIPSGVNSDNGEVCPTAVNADITVTFAAYKRGLLLYPGADFAGEIIFSDISIPDYIINRCNSDINIAEKNFIKNIFPKRFNNSQKSDYGKVFILGGSTGMTGAVTLSAKAAVLSGAGLVTVGIPQSLNSICEVKLTEPMTLPLPENSGTLSPEAFNIISEKMPSSDVLLFGPGAGRNENVSILLEKILSGAKNPVIVDADGLYHIANNPEMLDSSSCELIFTPHEMEFARLTGHDVKYVEKNRLELSRQYAIDNGVTLILKGHHTIVTAPDGTQYINTTGNPGMATGGSGDVLAGMISAFVAAGAEPFLACIISVYLHGRAGDIAAEITGETSLCANDILKNIPKSVKELTKNQ